MIGFFVKYNKEKLKLALEKIYKVKDIDKMNNDELVVCCMAETIKSLEKAESAETESVSLLKIEKALKNASDFSEFKAFCLEDYNETTRHIPKDSVTIEDNTPKEEPTMDKLAEFNLETYKEKVEADVNKARRTIDKFDEF